MQDRVRFALSYPEFIGDTKNLARVIEECLADTFGNNKFALEFAEGWLRIVTGVDYEYLIFMLLKLLPPSCRCIFATAHAYDILSAYSLPQLLLLLPWSETAAFALTHQHAIDSIETLTQVMLILPIEARTELAVLHMDKINKIDEQVMIRQLLPPEMQTEFEDNWYERRQAKQLANYGIFPSAKQEATITTAGSGLPATTMKPGCNK
jgi:hypothetical protein